jgi:antitoxin PrlF
MLKGNTNKRSKPMEPAKEYVGTLTTKGQVTVPAEVRRVLGIKPQGKVIFRVFDGRVELQPPTMTLEEAYGSVQPLNRPEDFNALRDKAIEEQVARILEEMQG